MPIQKLIHMKHIPLFLLLCISLLAVACATGKFQFAPDTVIAPPAPGVLHSGDVIQIVFPGATNMNTTQRIPLDGNIIMPFADPIPAVGKTTVELQADILQQFEAQLQLKEVSVTRISAAAVFYVSGAVLRPGKFPLERPISALEAVMEAGGPDPQRGKLQDVRVVRFSNGRQVTYNLDLKQALSGKGGAPFYLKPFDVIHVPAKTLNF